MTIEPPCHPWVLRAWPRTVEARHELENLPGLPMCARLGHVAAVPTGKADQFRVGSARDDWKQVRTRGVSVKPDLAAPSARPG